MTPAEIREARLQLGLTATGLAKALELGRGGDRTVRSWEAGRFTPSGPVRVALRLMLRADDTLQAQTCDRLCGHDPDEQEDNNDDKPT